MINTKHYCVGCKNKHEEESWRWRKKKIKNKTVWWCHKCVDCYGCKKIHLNETGRTKVTSEYTLCGKWFNRRPQTFEKKIQNMSTEEVLSGTDLGLKNQFKTESEDYTKEVRFKERKRLLKALELNDR